MLRLLFTLLQFRQFKALIFTFQVVKIFLVIRIKVTLIVRSFCLNLKDQAIIVKQALKVISIQQQVD